MHQLPASPDLSHLKKQAKHLLRDARAGEAAALRRFITTLPAARAMSLAAMAEHELKLHDAQSIIAREYGFLSWTELKHYLAWRRTSEADRLKSWLGWVIEGNARERALAIRTWRSEPDLFARNPWMACLTGEEAVIQAAISRDPHWANRPGGPLAMPPLIAVTHSGLILDEAFEAPLLSSARLLLRHGADVNASWTDVRWPDSPLSALYGAAGRTHHDGMTRVLLEAGADPNDNESLYHSVESIDPSCTKLLIEAGARVVGTNAVGRVLDYDKLDALQFLLRHGGDARERPWIHHAILRGRSLDHIRALVEAGGDLRAVNNEGISLYCWAQINGRADVVDLLGEHGIEEPLTDEERFVAACARGDEAAARDIQHQAPDIVTRLTAEQLQTMPRLAGLGEGAAVRTMLAVGWPREIKAGWDATALNLAAYQGRAAMVALLLDQGADWRTPHGFGDTVLGTLSYASQADDVADPATRDYIGCARVLIAHGVPVSAFRPYRFSAELTDYLDDLASGTRE